MVEYYRPKFSRKNSVAGKNEIGAVPEDVSEEMGDLLSEMAGVPDEKALTAAAYYHAKFETPPGFSRGEFQTISFPTL